jgi:hypothetical protein
MPDMKTILFASALGPLDNPMKGWAPLSGVSTKRSLAFVYLDWKTVEPQEGVYDFSAIDKAAALPGNKGARFVIRLKLDAPNAPANFPQWIVDKKVPTIAYQGYIDDSSINGGGIMIDYNNAIVKAALVKLILAMGAKFNSDHRIAFVQIGTLGQWGEWTTYRAGNILRFSGTTQKLILETFRAAFPDKKLLGRLPYHQNDPTAVSLGGNYSWLGYHDDMFPFQTASVMLPNMAIKGRTGTWRANPMGGEIWPGREQLMLAEPYADIAVSANDNTIISSARQPFNSYYAGTRWKIIGGGQANIVTILSADDKGFAQLDAPAGNPGALCQAFFIDDSGNEWDQAYNATINSIYAFHPTFMGPYIFPGPYMKTMPTAAQTAKAQALVRLMGYQYRLLSLSVPKTITAGAPCKITLNGINEGTAPFYYPWKVKMALLQNDVPIEEFYTSWDITKWQPGNFVELFVFTSQTPGDFTLAIKIEDPWAEAAKPGIEFANKLPFNKLGYTSLMNVKILPKAATPI